MLWKRKSVSLEAGLAKWRRRRRIRDLEWLGEDTNTKRAAEPMCMDNIPIDLNVRRFIGIGLNGRVIVNITGGS